MSSLKKSSPLISRLSAALSRPFSTHSDSSRILSSFRFDQDKLKNRDLPAGLPVKLISGIVLGSGLGLGLWVWSSSSSQSSSDSFADWATRKAGFDSCSDDLDTPIKPRKYLLADSYRRKIFFNYERRIRMRSPPEKMFDLDSNGEIDMEEFKKVMALMRAHNRQGAHHRDGLRTGLKVNHSVEEGGLLEFFFGKDGKTCLQHSRFIEFLRELHDEILRLEFAHYDYKQRGTISVKDFALSMVASAEMSQISKFLRRVDELSNEADLREKRITLEEFMAFAELRKQLQPLSVAIFSYGEVNGFLNKDDFQRAASNVCGVSLTDTVVDIIYHVFDVNCDGSLSVSEFIKVLHSRENDISRTNTEGVLGSILCWLNGSKNSPMKNVFSK